LHLRPHGIVDPSWLSNGCVVCDRLMGQFYEHDAWADGEIVAEFPVRLTERWRSMLDEGRGDDYGRIRPPASGRHASGCVLPLMRDRVTS
jgi:hypothetical protein